MGLKVGDFTIMEYNSGGGIIGLLSHIDDNSMTTLKWSYGFHGGQSSYGLGTVENSVKKIPTKDIKKVDDTYYIKEKCESITTNTLISKYSNKLVVGIKNSEIISKIKEFRNTGQLFDIYIIHKVKIQKNGLNVNPFKVIIKPNDIKSKINIKT